MSDAQEQELPVFDDIYEKSEEDRAREAEAREVKRGQTFLFSETNQQDLSTMLGRKLHPFSAGRFMMFNHLRNGLGCAPLAYSIGASGEFFPEAARILFLCFHTSEELEVLDPRPQQLENKVKEWAETTLQPADYEDTEKIALRIWNHCHAFVGEPVEKGDPAVGKPQIESSSPPRWWARMWLSLRQSSDGQNPSSSGNSPCTVPTPTS